MLKRFHGTLAALLLAGSGSVMAASPPHPDPQSDVRLLSMQLFWFDDVEPRIPGMQEVSPSSLHDRWDLRHYDYARSRVLRAEEPGGWHAGLGSALVVVPRAGDRWAHYTLTTAFRDPQGGLRYRIDSVIGTRTRGKFGTVHTLDLARVAVLPRFARDEISDLVNPQLLERSVYWEGAFELHGLRRDEISRVDALGPGLIKPPKKWLRVLDAMLQPPEIPAQAEGHNCLGIGPLRLCLNLPRLATLLARGRSLKERNEVRLTRSLWHAGESSGVVVVGRLIDYSVVTFRVRTNGKGPHPKGVFDLRPFHLTGALAKASPRVDPGPAVPGQTFRPPNTIDRFASERRIAIGRDGNQHLQSRRHPRPPSLSLEAILARAFSPERE
jgi:hypothetical protein